MSGFPTSSPSRRKRSRSSAKARWEARVEIVEVAVLTIVAVATASSGYQAARRDGQQSPLQGHATADRMAAPTSAARLFQDVDGAGDHQECH